LLTLARRAELASPTLLRLLLPPFQRKSWLERVPLRYAIYAAVLRARNEEGAREREGKRFHTSTSVLAKNLAELPKDMVRAIVEFTHGVVSR
jgi:hypothetical protein